MTAMSTQPESNDRGRLPRSINKLVPTPGPDAQRITALLRDGGRISGYHLENGRILSKEEGITLAKEGGIRGVAVAERNGSEYLRTLPDEEIRNLTQLPTIDPPASF